MRRVLLVSMAPVLLGSAALILLACGCAHEPLELPAQGEWTLSWTRLPDDSLTVGDPFHVRLQGSHRAGGEVCKSPWESLSPDVALRDARDIRVRKLGDTLMVWSQDVTLAPFRTGALEVGPLTILVAAAGETLVHVSDILVVPVASVLGDSTLADLRDIKPPFHLGGPWWPYVAAAAALILALLAAAYIWRRRRLEAQAGRPRLPPWEEFTKDLRRLEGRNLPEKGEWGEYTLRLGWLTRRYLERRFEVPVLEMTTTEIRRWIPDAELGMKEGNRLLRWLDQTDLIKFARSVPALEECGRLRDEARDLVSEVETSWQEAQSQEKEASAEPFMEKTGTGR